jgi:hypothetical protein
MNTGAGMKKEFAIFISVAVLVAACNQGQPGKPGTGGLMETGISTPVVADEQAVFVPPEASGSAGLPGSAGSNEPVVVISPQEAPEVAMAAEPVVAGSGLLEGFMELARSVSDENGMNELDLALDILEADGLLDVVEAKLMAELASAVAESGESADRVYTNQVPGLQLALSAIYGRKGMMNKAYAALSAAESAAKAPGVSFSLAVIYGRKAMLQPSPYGVGFSLSVRCNIPGAEVKLDQTESSPAPASLEAIRAGTHEIEVSAFGHHLYRTNITGKDGDSLDIIATLLPIPIPLKVTTDPLQAELFIDQKPVGSSPWVKELIPGSYVVEARYVNHVPVKTVLNLAVGGLPQEVSMKLEPLPAYLSVSADVPNTEVFINGEKKGIAPVRLAIDPSIQTSVRGSNPDWIYASSLVQTISVPPGEEKSLHIEVPRKTGVARFMAEMNVPPKARISIDGVYRGTVPFSIADFPYGRYVVQIEADGYESKTMQWAFTGSQLAIDPMKPGLVVIPVNAIKVDGKILDWDGLKPLFMDPPGNKQTGQNVKGLDIIEGYVARDDRYLYWMIRFADGKPGSGTGTVNRELHFSFGPDPKTGRLFFMNLRVEFGSDGVRPFIQTWHLSGNQEVHAQSVTSGCSYRTGPDFIEAAFPLSSIKQLAASFESAGIRMRTGIERGGSVNSTNEIKVVMPE